MAIALVEAEIDRFLVSDRSEVLCIRGKWGVGKTFTWNKLLRRVSGRAALKSYAYVSLFGVNSLDQLKYSIFENTVAVKDAGVEPSVESFQSNTDAVVKRVSRKSLSLLQTAPVVRSYASALQSLSFLSVRRCIVCVDDLERKGAQLSMKDVLGLVAHLRDQKLCKVTLILNDGDLEGADKADFERFNEKVIDISLEFAPDAADCARIALDGNGAVQQQLRKTTVPLAISNIRIIKKIERFATDIAQLVSKFDHRVLHQAVQSVAVFGWSVFSKDAPPVDFLCQKRTKDFFGLREENDFTAEEKGWNSMLDEIGFTTVDDFDLILLEGIRRGYFNEAALSRQAEELDKRAKAVSSEDSIRAAWRHYHDSFDNNEQQVVDAVLTALHNEVRFISPMNLGGLVSLLRGLSRDREATEVIDYYMESRKEEDRKFFDLSEYAFGDDVTDPEVRAAFDARYRVFSDDRSPVDVLLHIAEHQSWGLNDRILLAKVTSDELFEIFKSQRGDNLSGVIRAALQFERIGGIEPELRDVSLKAKEALVRIGKENPLNYRRVKKYGIDASA
jgi:hypothetical protein